MLKSTCEVFAEDMPTVLGEEFRGRIIEMIDNFNINEMLEVESIGLLSYF
jgi:hypothetical protein